uniref:Ribonuclease T2 domain-containing protein n=1 Tax=Glyptapanteles flavicoxis TaxID=463051 RepID=B7S8A1_9HYME|nr:ribonuclease T2 domain-containing protein [Glyptapanteles flavicoxis]
MMCTKRLLVCLTFQTLLIISEAGRNLKPNSQASGLRSSATGTGLGSANSGRFRPQNPANFPGPGPQTSGTSAQFSPQTPGAPVWPRLQTLVHFPSSISSVGRPESPTNNGFPPLRPPDSTFQTMPRSASSSSISSTGSGFLRPGRSSLSSLGSISSGYGSSANLQELVGLDAPRSTAIQTSIASAETCVDRGTVPVIIASAENCFDYFTLAVSWAPGYAYKQWKNGKNIRETKVTPLWIIHGLWPSMFDRSTDPMLTCWRSDIFFNWNRFTTSKILGTLDNSWYTIFAKGYNNKKLWEHEFKDHGSCASRSSVIGDDVNYFIRTIQLVQQLNISSTLASSRYKAGFTTKLRDIIGIMKNKLEVNIRVDYVLHPQTGENYLSELFICYDVKLKLMDCPNGVLPNYKLDTDIKLVEQLPTECRT